MSIPGYRFFDNTVYLSAEIPKDGDLLRRAAISERSTNCSKR